MKAEEDRARPGFDEQRAAEELQHLQQEIQRARADRERAEAEFDEFLRGFRAPPRPRATRAGAACQPHPASGFVRAETLGPRVPSESLPPTAAPVAHPAAELDADERVAASAAAEPAKAAPVRKPQRSVRTPLLLTLAAVAVAIGVFAIRARRPALAPSDPVPPAVVTTPSPENPAPPARETAATPAPATPAPAPTPGSEPGAGVNLEMVTLRPVWVRVTVDGQRTIERELPAGERIPLRGDRTILIRAGDAGAVTVSRDGGNQTPIGRDGVAATREFSAAGGRGSAPPR